MSDQRVDVPEQEIEQLRDEVGRLREALREIARFEHVLAADSVVNSIGRFAAAVLTDREVA